MRPLLLTLLRCALSAWVGAAVLFVVNAVRQVTFPGFDTITRNQLALLRFPAYYGFGFTLVGSAVLCALLLAARDRPHRRRWLVIAGLVVVSLSIMAYDFLHIYHPLASIVTPLDRPPSTEFARLHHLSEVVNTVHVGLAFVAAILASWPCSLPASPGNPTR